MPTQPSHRLTTVRLREDLLGDALRVVDAEFASDLTIDVVARRVASSRRQLQRVFREQGDTTFRAYLTSVRMNRAAELLSAEGVTSREAARRVGYSQPAQFAKAFRRHHGYLPSELRGRRHAGDRGAG